MKRLITLLLAFCVCLGGFALVGCDKVESPVTEEQWRVAFDFISYENLEITLNVTDKEYGEKILFNIAWDGEVLYLGNELEDGLYEEYIAQVGSQYFYYSKENDEWEKESLDKSKYEEYLEEFFTLDGITLLADNYSDFTYNEATKLFLGNDIAHEEFEDEKFNASVSFVDGKIKQLRAMSEKRAISIAFNFGTAEISLPAVSDDAFVTTVTEEQWREAFDFSSYENLEFVMAGYSFNLEEEVKIVVARTEKIIYACQEDSNANIVAETYFVKDGSQFFYYAKQDNEWVKNAISQYVYDIYVDQFMTVEGLDSFAENYADFTYNEETKSYVGENFLNESIGSYFDASVFFENGKIKEIVILNDMIDAVFTLSYGTAEITLPAV